MPEGDTIFRAASRLRQALVYNVIQSAVVSTPWSQGIAADKLQGRRVIAVVAIAKWLRIELEDDHNLLSHMGMTGSWHIYALGQRWHKAEKQSAVVLRTEQHCVVCFSPKRLQLLTSQQLRRQPQLRRLGPDILSEDFDAAGTARSIVALGNHSLAEAALDQRVVAGIGNVYRSETLFISRLHPFARCRDFEPETIVDWLTQSRTLMRRNLTAARRQTRLRTAGPAKWVYRRNGQHCLICDEQIQRRYIGDRNRSIYWCPRCQAQ